MPELPDVVVYVEALQSRIAGQVLERIRLASPFLVRSVSPPIREAEGKEVRGLRRIGKRIVVELADDLFLVLHLMIAGRLKWLDRGGRVPGKIGLAAFDFTSGTLALTEASTKKRASLHLVRGEAALQGFDRGGIEPLGATLPDFRAALQRENRTLKRALTDPTILSGIGNAYSDEILHRARLSPSKRTRQLTPGESADLHAACQGVLVEWTDRLRRERGEGFPQKVTAFREGMAVHGRFGKPCPVCAGKVQRIAHAENEANYCPRCQTRGRLLADRALSRLLGEDWPRTLEELEAGVKRRRSEGDEPG